MLLLLFHSKGNLERLHFSSLLHFIITLDCSVAKALLFMPIATRISCIFFLLIFHFLSVQCGLCLAKALSVICFFPCFSNLEPFSSLTPVAISSYLVSSTKSFIYSISPYFSILSYFLDFMHKSIFTLCCIFVHLFGSITTSPTLFIISGYKKSLSQLFLPKTKIQTVIPEFNWSVCCYHYIYLPEYICSIYIASCMKPHCIIWVTF